MVVGRKTSQTFYVHEKLIRASSPFFDAALGKRWKEGIQRVVALPADEGDVFDLYMQYLYSGKVASKLEAATAEFENLVQLYVLGEKFLDRQFQDRVVDALIAATHQPRPSKQYEHGTARWFPTAETLVPIYEHTPVGSPIRQLMVDMHLAHGIPKWLDADVGQHSKEFLLDLSRASLDGRKPIVVNHRLIDAEPHCDYHQHGAMEPCGIKRKRRNAGTNLTKGNFVLADAQACSTVSIALVTERRRHVFKARRVWLGGPPDPNDFKFMADLAVSLIDRER